MLGRAALSLANDLADALVIEKRGHARRAYVDANTAANDHCLGMINVDMLAASEAHRKGPKWSALLVGLKHLVKILGGHATIIPYAEWSA